jgi:hypothetical protein
MLSASIDIVSNLCRCRNYDLLPVSMTLGHSFPDILESFIDD